ncbi:MAG: hypothetical protein C9355_08165 [Thalassolituus maritimus]|uniref:Uncharacterized protein n=1 Tax=Thalassolituus maritimus TaxID=484498 RepID=A0A1N7L0P3_9GAMM|nr:hypothetical protein [Thalassolituus maritimus]TPD54487.1 MAG: hypothetical protein C9355_08165 [Thalassolituus maritimus]SIS67413.1 hypothetical protein SAMN05421686_103210 [Thalassolituus maritimus]
MGYAALTTPSRAKRASLFFDEVHIVVADPWCSKADEEILNSFYFEPNVSDSDMPITVLKRYQQGLHEGKYREMVLSDIAISNNRVVPIIDVLALTYPKDDIRNLGVGFCATLDNLPTIDERLLEWEQALEIRSDTDSLKRIRRLRGWFLTGLANMGVDEASDVLSLAIEDYENSLKKHGVATVIGCMSILVKKEQLIGTASATLSAGYFGGEVMAALTASGMLLANVALSIAEKKSELIEIKNIDPNGVGLLLDIEEKLSITVKN